MACEQLLNHFKCYKTRAGVPFTPTMVHLTDQFGGNNTQVVRPFRLCNPADKNSEGMIDPTAHAMCYQIRDTGGRLAHRNVLVQNQFGEQVLTVLRPETYCVPASKNSVPVAQPFDRMKCYQVKQTAGEHAFPAVNVSLTDQFESKDTTVLKPFLICNPTDQDDEGTLNPSCHLTCYKIKDVGGQTPFTPRDITEQDEFNESSVSAIRNTCAKASLLCVPSLKFEQ
jgi:hypothetical protein